MPACRSCGERKALMELRTGLCSKCRAEKAEREFEDERAQHSRQIEAEAPSSIVVTTETAHNLPVIERIGIISAECVYGMHIFKDLLTDIRNVVGGRSDTFQKTMRSAKETVLFELRKEAHAVGAQAVVGVTISYSQIGQTVGSMLMVSAVGTAVRLEAPPTH